MLNVSHHFDVCKLYIRKLLKLETQNMVERDYSEEPSEQHGHPVQVISVQQDNTLEFKEEALREVLLKDTIKDLPVAVVSVAGKYRQGKSFLLSFFLNYLHSQQVSGSSGYNVWMPNEDFELQGFEWKGGQKRVTNGIMIWSEPFIVKTPQGKVAVVLMDTQGTDDIGAKDGSEVPIFALSTLLSSVLVFNVIKLARSDLRQLRLFMDYGIMASKNGGNTSKKPFQTLQFLLRDWNSPNTHPYGEKGGAEYIKELQKSEGGEDLGLDAAFDKVSCFLMPHPGKAVDNDAYNGNVKDIDGDFTGCLREFVPMILNKNKLIFKEDLRGVSLTATAWCELFQEYVDFFKKHKVPEPKTLMHTFNKKAYKKAFDVAKTALETESNSLKEKYDPNFNRTFDRIQKSTMKVFNDEPKLEVDAELESRYSEKLLQEISNLKRILAERNEKYKLEKDYEDLQKERMRKRKIESTDNDLKSGAIAVGVGAAVAVAEVGIAATVGVVAAPVLGAVLVGYGTYKMFGYFGRKLRG